MVEPGIQKREGQRSSFDWRSGATLRTSEKKYRKAIDKGRHETLAFQDNAEELEDWDVEEGDVEPLLVEEMDLDNHLTPELLLENEETYQSCVRFVQDFLAVVGHKKRNPADQWDIQRILRSRLSGCTKVKEIVEDTGISTTRVHRLNEDIRFIGRGIKASGQYKSILKRIVSP